MAQEPLTQRPAKPPARQFPLRITYAAIAVVFGWPLFLAFWLFYYASGFSILEKHYYCRVLSRRRFDRRNNPMGSVEHETRVKTAIVHGRARRSQGAMVQ